MINLRPRTCETQRATGTPQNFVHAFLTVCSPKPSFPATIFFAASTFSPPLTEIPQMAGLVDFHMSRPNQNPRILASPN